MMKLYHNIVPQKYCPHTLMFPRIGPSVCSNTLMTMKYCPRGYSCEINLKQQEGHYSLGRAFNYKIR